MRSSRRNTRHKAPLMNRCCHEEFFIFTHIHTHTHKCRYICIHIHTYPVSRSRSAHLENNSKPIYFFICIPLLPPNRRLLQAPCHVLMSWLPGARDKGLQGRLTKHRDAHKTRAGGAAGVMAECRFGMSFASTIARRPWQGYRLLRFVVRAEFEGFFCIKEFRDILVMNGYRNRKKITCDCKKYIFLQRYNKRNPYFFTSTHAQSPNDQFPPSKTDPQNDPIQALFFKSAFTNDFSPDDTKTSRV